ncbi:hypothetical protein [Gemmatimonas sp.]|uniref:hypothetical protein n=1 Tax=Gemmatimonas sp. TaxID=1962908 RepID=UPI00286D021D|nr:hypothetical protein [Gemmatimonas sp.]
MNDTTATTQHAYDALLAGMTPAERLQRMLSLTCLARDLAWAGAERAVGHLGRPRVVERFFLQLYGPDIAVPPRVLAAAADVPAAPRGV